METLEGPDGLTAEVLIEGDGDEAVVFLHSSASGVLQWRAYQEALSAEYTTAAVHLYGYGATTKWHGPHRQRLDDQGRLVGTVVKALGRPTHIVGHSFGGAVALETARQRRDDVVSVAVFEPTVFWVLRSAAPAAWEEISRMARAVKTGVACADLGTAASAFIDYWAQDHVWERMSARQQATIAAAMAAVAHEWDAGMTPPAAPEEWLADVPAPTLLIVAPDSPTPVREVARVLARNGQRRLHVMTSGGHMMPIANPAAVRAVVEPFLARHRVAGSTTRRPLTVAGV